ncbi:MAG: hypothetical protein VX722_05220 [Pseudomonadota bacterium]|mgnify:FL=1|jgi:hypothetical protein|nr:hypothetical protein [Pseudomonadota bacterium]MEC7620484.1 hypothetical protein [Pseudomonadota bacterium]MEC7938320.1 hypothetical protein [Pseudomonadota bacterium]MEC8499301.1 hypothetical protein [Pseudomonadota bacterium]MED5310463.1 hypothetical protein [Pseudomonadota bacterium]|tara:strand:+ start:581 stop:943 length:363 start_codon:yes stop_codon:yes gene_type:complete
MMTNKTKNNSLLPYGTSSSAPAIKLPDLKLFHSERGSIARNYFENAAELLNKEFNELKELSELNDIVYGASYNFVPRVGQKYHLYQKEDGSYLLSMIENWKTYKFLASVTYTADSVWKRS